ncbi:hypothetical protein Bca4012_056234 [Brassica carinata]|uniref:Uncharacterized protein n=1 Tax=Brassica carinata TaxID=52824 RepID=A0A8X7W1X0_BRACI|nr:hypothetical protein Bca52824_013943 [Brassica carinata]
MLEYRANQILMKTLFLSQLPCFCLCFCFLKPKKTKINTREPKKEFPEAKVDVYFLEKLDYTNLVLVKLCFCVSV